jgi:anti-sigma B factor antagonist
MNKLKIRLRRVGEIVILELDGKITIGDTNRQLHTALKELVTNGATKIILNLENVRTIDSTGLGELVAGFTTLKAHGGSLVLANLPMNVMNLMTITKLYTVFEVFESETEALSELQNAARITQPLDDGFPASAKAGSSIH